MNWGDFKTAVRTYLLVDAERKGRGIQNYINRLIRAAIIDLQRYIPELRAATVTTYRNAPTTVTEWDSTKAYAEYDIVKFNNVTHQAIAATTAGESPSVEIYTNNDGEPQQGKWVRVNLLTPTAEGIGVEGTYDKPFTEIKEVWVRRWPTTENKLKTSTYHQLFEIPWEDRYKILDGGHASKRSCARPGRIAFGANSFITTPELLDDEKLMINASSEGLDALLSTPWLGSDNVWDANSLVDNTVVVFDDMEAKAIADYVKAHLQREVDKDLKMFESYMRQYQKERQEIYRVRKQYKPSDLLDQGVGTNSVGQYPVSIAS